MPSVKVTWDAPTSGDNPDGYRVYRSMDGGNTWTQIADVGANTLSFDDTNRPDGDDHLYGVTAYNTVSTTGEDQESDKATDPAVTPPGSINLSHGDNTTSNADVTASVLDAGDISSMAVEGRFDTDGTGFGSWSSIMDSPFSVSSDPTTVDWNHSQGKDVAIEARVRIQGGFSGAWSPWITSTTLYTIPTADSVGDPSYTADDDIGVSVTANANFPNLRDYEVRVNGGTWGIADGNSLIPEISITDTSGSANEKREYRTVVYAPDGTASDPANASKPVGTSLAAPSNFSLTVASTTEITGSWDNVPTATTYEFQWADDSSGSPGTYSTVTDSDTLKSTKDSLSEGNTYWFRVRARRAESGWINGTVDSSWSADKSKMTNVTIDAIIKEFEDGDIVSGVGVMAVDEQSLFDAITEIVDNGTDPSNVSITILGAGRSNASGEVNFSFNSTANKMALLVIKKSFQGNTYLGVN